MNTKDKIKNAKYVWVKGFIEKNGDIIIPVSDKGALYIIKAPYKNGAVWKYDEEETDERN